MHRLMVMARRLKLSALLATLALVALPASRGSDPKPPHGTWTGKIVRIDGTSVTLLVSASWTYGSLDSTAGVGDIGTFHGQASGFSVEGKETNNQGLSHYFKAGEIVTLRWEEEGNDKKRIFFDISKGDDRVFVPPSGALQPRETE